MKNKTLIYKIIFIIGILIFFLLISNNNVYATTSYESTEGIVYNGYDISDFFNHVPKNADGEYVPFFIYQTAAGNIMLYCSDNTNVDSMWIVGENLVFCSNGDYTSTYTFDRYMYSTSTGLFSYDGTKEASGAVFKTSRFIYLSVDIYYSDTMELFFEANLTSEDYCFYYHDNVRYVLPAIPTELFEYNNYYLVKKKSGEFRFVYHNEEFVYHEQCSSFYESDGVDCIESVDRFYLYTPGSTFGWSVDGYYTGCITGLLQPSTNYWHTLIYLKSDIYDENGVVVFSASDYTGEEETIDDSGSGGEIEEDTTVVNPKITNTAEYLSTSTFEAILITPGTFSNTENIDFYIYNITDLEEGVDIYSQTPVFSTTLNSSSSYYEYITVDNVVDFWYEIPRESLGIDFKYGNTYFYSLLLGGAPVQEIQATIGGLTEEDILNNNFNELEQTIVETNKELQNSINEQTEAIKENNETNKNIFEKIGDILSYINPLSENFFAYKLVELLMDGLKGLFVPADNFFSDYFDELNNWFAERLGFLYYPLDLIFDLLDRIININFEEPVVEIPDIKEPTTNITLIKATSFNFNSLLENSVFSNIHNIYFLIVDAGIYIGLVALLMKKYEEVMTK